MLSNSISEVEAILAEIDQNGEALSGDELSTLRLTMRHWAECARQLEALPIDASLVSPRPPQDWKPAIVGGTDVGDGYSEAYASLDAYLEDDADEEDEFAPWY